MVGQKVGDPGGRELDRRVTDILPGLAPGVLLLAGFKPEQL